jgi:hypothetical protein
MTLNLSTKGWSHTGVPGAADWFHHSTPRKILYTLMAVEPCNSLMQREGRQTQRVLRWIQPPLQLFYFVLRLHNHFQSNIYVYNIYAYIDVILIIVQILSYLLKDQDPFCY